MLSIRRFSVLRALAVVLALAVWLTVAALGGPAQGRLSQVQTNDAAAFLPGPAESTRAGDAAREFSDTESLPALVVLRPDALGVDYSIFLMTRVREESGAWGTRPGVLRGLAVTGSVITSAGVVLAATFAALAVIPLLFLAQLAFIVAFGVLVDTLVVRSLLVPALVHDVGRHVWWPSRWDATGHGDRRPATARAEREPAATPRLG